MISLKSENVVDTNEIPIEDLTIDDKLDSFDDVMEIDIDAIKYDLGNLIAYDPSPISDGLFEGDIDKNILNIAKKLTNGIKERLKKLPVSDDPKPLIILPKPEEEIPRALPFPAPKPLTRWEKFAKEKGIQKKRKEGKVWDEQAQDWRPRYGFRKANNKLDVPFIEAKEGELIEDPYLKLEMEKKERVDEQNKREQKNALNAIKSGYKSEKYKIDYNIDFDEEKEKKQQMKNKIHKEIQESSKSAGFATASMGKFDKKIKGESHNERVHEKKRKKLVGNTMKEEIENMAKIANRIISENSGGVIDMNTAIGKMEAQRRDEVHAEKIAKHIKK